MELPLRIRPLADLSLAKLLDSLIIGLICFVLLGFANMPYVLLVSVIVGVTNVIPFFGPFIGAIPSAFLILLSDPMKCLYFLIFILLLQQFDGNILGPKILGDSTGLSSFWVLFRCSGGRRTVRIYRHGHWNPCFCYHLCLCYKKH